MFLHLIILRACIGIIWRLTIKLVLHKKRMRCVLRTRDEIEIYHHHHSIPCSGNPFKSMFPLQTPGFQARYNVAPPGEETDYVRVHCRNVRCIISLRRFLWAFDYFRLHAKKTTHDIAHRSSSESSEQKHIRTNHNHWRGMACT